MTDDESLDNTYRLMKKETDFNKVQKYIERQTDIAYEEAKKTTRLACLKEKGWTEDEYYLAFGKDYLLNNAYYGPPIVVQQRPRWWEFWKMIKISKNGF